MDLFSRAGNLSDDMKKFWSDTYFSSGLIQANNTLPVGNTLRLVYPSSKGTVDPCNIADLPFESSKLGVKIIQSYESGNNIKFEKKLSNWVLLARTMLDHSICYLEIPTEKFRTKAIVTRNLSIANSVSRNPIQNFDVFKRIIFCDVDFFNNNAMSDEVRATVLNIIAHIRLGNYTAVTSWLCSTFNTDKKTVMAFMKAASALSIGYDSCIEGKCFFLKLKSEGEGYYHISSVVKGTEYEIPTTAIFVPLPFLRKQAEGIIDMLKSGIVLARFTRDNNVVRDLLASCNQQVIDAIYHRSDTRMNGAQVEYIEDRGYIRTTDLCASEINCSTQRAISLARIIAIQGIAPDMTNLTAQLKPYGFDPSLSTTDMNNVITIFKGYIDKLGTNLKLLQMLYNALSVANTEKPVFASAQQAIIAINDYVDVHNLYTTSYARTLHLFMLANPIFFAGYTGQPEQIKGITLTTRHASLGIES